jgi:hypothetical protein
MDAARDNIAANLRKSRLVCMFYSSQKKFVRRLKETPQPASLPGECAIQTDSLTAERNTEPGNNYFNNRILVHCAFE